MSDDQVLQLILTIAVCILILEQIILGFVVWGLVSRLKKLTTNVHEIVEAGKIGMQKTSLPRPLRIGVAFWEIWKRKAA